MDKLVSLTKVDRFLESLKRDCLIAEARALRMKLLIDEEDKLGRDLERLELAFSRIRSGKWHVLRIRKLRNRFACGSEARKRAEQLLITTIETQQWLKSTYEELRCKHLKKVSSHSPGSN